MAITITPHNSSVLESGDAPEQGFIAAFNGIDDGNISSFLRQRAVQFMIHKELDAIGGRELLVGLLELLVRRAVAECAALSRDDVSATLRNSPTEGQLVKGIFEQNPARTADRNGAGLVASRVSRDRKIE